MVQTLFLCIGRLNIRRKHIHRKSRPRSRKCDATGGIRRKQRQRSHGGFSGIRRAAGYRSGILLARRWESLFLTEYDPFVHEEVQATGHAQRQQVTPHDIPLEHFLYKKQEGHLDKKGTDTGEVVAAQVTEKRPCGTARHPVLPDKEIGHDEIGHGGALERDDRRDDVLAHISAEKPLGADPKHESVHDRSKEARRGKLDESFA